MAVAIDDLLRRAVESRASDLHLKVGNHPYLRVDGILSALNDVPRITPDDLFPSGPAGQTAPTEPPGAAGLPEPTGDDDRRWTDPL